MSNCRTPICAPKSLSQGFPYYFAAGTADEDPGNGQLQFNEMVQVETTEIYVSYLAATGASIEDFLIYMSDLTNTIYGQLYILKADNSGKGFVFNVTAVTLHAEYAALSVTVVDELLGPDPFDFADGLIFSFAQAGSPGPGGGPQGAQGSQGAVGSQGAQGSQGSQGVTGSQGSQGTQGSVGVQGAQGDVGAQGSSGAQGSQGSQGVTGLTGPQGAKGSQGDVGAQGVQGAIGNTGPQGAKGLTGDTGPQGTQGVQGATGNQGVQGNQGAQGTQGNQGVQGAQGYQGFQGVRGFQGFTGNQGVQGATGFQGELGAQGNQGFQGVAGAGFQGAQGVQGSQGDVGAQGSQGSQGAGAQGAQGAQGDIGAQGDVGAQGSQGAQGDVGAQGVQGVQGAQGDVGAQGAQGFQGDVGAQGFQGSSGASEVNYYADIENCDEPIGTVQVLGTPISILSNTTDWHRCGSGGDPDVSQISSATLRGNYYYETNGGTSATNGSRFVQLPPFFLRTIDLGVEMTVSLDTLGPVAVDQMDIVVARYDSLGNFIDLIAIDGDVANSTCSDTPSQSIFGTQFKGTFTAGNDTSQLYTLRIRSINGGQNVSFDTIKVMPSYYIPGAIEPSVTVQNDPTNNTFVGSGQVPALAGATAADGQTSTATFSTQAMMFMVTIDTGDSFICHTNYFTSLVTSMSDPGNKFLISDAGVGVYIFKSSSSSVLSVKNRLGSSHAILIQAINSQITSATPWA